MMNEQTANAKMLTKLMFRLLPIQITLAAVGSVNGIVSSFFASNFVGVDAMSAVGLYGPLNMLLGAVSLMLGSPIFAFPGGASPGRTPVQSSRQGSPAPCATVIRPSGA